MDSLNSMRFATIYALVVGAANVISGPIIGYAVDRQGRRRTVTAALVTQALLVLASWFITRSALSLGRAHHPRMVALMAALITSCTVSSLANLASTLAIERDWIAVLAMGGERLPPARHPDSVPGRRADRDGGLAVRAAPGVGGFGGGVCKRCDGGGLYPDAADHLRA
eukprot:CAMPEP_0172040254 /NCGR_PEP_ID=MMETSP1041-20130122/24388_1 /TAXON_ID=464988 /ORGANISM="Hemiselmis andersenii, Strain CCMP439" /LENGTH=167 /DNA_ID=CAMNT_0012698115 /DNA_START=132 /DNA_END=631 /DNA_ORIENTATION=+